MDLYGFKDNKRGRGKNDQKSNTCYTIPKKKKKGGEKSNSTNNLIAERSEERSSSINYGK